MGNDGGMPKVREEEITGQGCRDTEARQPEPPDIDSLDQRTVPGHLIRRAQQRAADLFFEEVGHHRTSPRQFAVLHTVYRHEFVSQSELVTLTGIDRSTLADIVQRLESRGLVQRERSAEDHRRKRTGITPAGVEELRAVLPGMLRAQERILERVPAAQRNHLLHCLRLLADLPADGMSPGDGDGSDS